MGNFDRGSRGRGFGRGGSKQSGRDAGSRGYGRGPASYGGREDREMHHAVCDNCGKDCEVPFKPTGSKPVLCSDCFGKSREGSEPRRFNNRDQRRSGGGQPQNNKQLEVINAKLDQVLALLNNAPKGKSSKVSKEPSVEAPPVLQEEEDRENA